MNGKDVDERKVEVEAEVTKGENTRVEIYLGTQIWNG
jgi:hypothetical protein